MRTLLPPLQDSYGQINSIDFHRSHDFLVAGHDEGKMTLYNTYEGKKLAALDCSKYGVANVAYTHHMKSVVHSSTVVRIFTQLSCSLRCQSGCLHSMGTLRVNTCI